MNRLYDTLIFKIRYGRAILLDGGLQGIARRIPKHQILAALGVQTAFHGKWYSYARWKVEVTVDDIFVEYFRPQGRFTIVTDRRRWGYAAVEVESFCVHGRAYGKTPGEWIDDCVVSDARALLKGTSQTVQQISQQLGFPSQSFFGKYFKRSTGFSPSAYREL